MVTARYVVKGMTCGHCVSAVQAEVGGIDGVTGVDVDLGGGTVTVTSRSALDDAVMRAAVDEAGYEIAG